ncbi:hypothetical protein Van01_54400 [Micromonospora andamanensis]|uniref:DUF86 domain-containing protein n=1 Tax=Micromonospora andamanensis TaxID=1287068 RepID=A0ABQ4I2W6_9ACTN|nr:hypothetical protein Van01_54400 [Micromonospora andamanensis]
MQIIGKARIARNFLAHEGMAVDPVWDLLLQDIAERASLLRAAAGDLVGGDHLTCRMRVSRRG